MRWLFLLALSLTMACMTHPDLAIIVHVQDAHGHPINGAAVTLDGDWISSDVTRGDGDTQPLPANDRPFVVTVSAPGFLTRHNVPFTRTADSRIVLQLLADGGA